MKFNSLVTPIPLFDVTSPEVALYVAFAVPLTANSPEFAENIIDKEAIETATATLTEASGVIAQKMYSEEAGAQGDAEASDNAGADDAVDAEFEEVKEDKGEDKK